MGDTHRTVPSLLTQMSFPGHRLVLLIGLCLGLSQLSHGTIHTLRHVLIFGTLRLWHVHHLQLQLPYWIRRPALQRDALLTPRAAHRDFFHGPFVDAENVDRVGSAKGLLLVFIKRNMRPR